ncbi:hypothetical protein [Siminovitchia fortis]|uniref:Uncharacterized protein n=1 Tax=Siminovitchia fortis TaxID=254758 RepID=A0A443IZP0_9BACI|nr:hypothetical protein [Siminovitchia fortis]RWR13579.1 hypothetical protein D4N35_003950 [Siminovitchia fortis]WHY81965.1 hypothetical protein QNH23_00595 [Siminovitchia fortis]
MNHYYQTDPYGYPMANYGYPVMTMPRGDERLWGRPWGWGWGFGGPFFRPWGFGFGFPFFPFFW